MTSHGDALVRLVAAAPPVCSPTFLRPGERLAGRYEIEAVIGEGGFGIVYRARVNTGGYVAIKVCKQPADGELLATKIRPVPPNIVIPIEVGRHGGHSYLVFPYLDGVTLEKRLQNGPVSLDEALEVAREVARAMCSAHDCGVLHRDLKPANIFLCGRQEGTQIHGSDVRVIDFGLAHCPQADGMSPQPGGTRFFTDPLQREQNLADERCDVYSAAVVLYACLGGPIRTGTNARITDDDIKALAAPKALKRQLCAATSDRLEERPTAKAWREALREPKSRRHLALGVSVGIGALGLAVGAGVAFHRSAASPAPLVQSAPRDAISERTVQEHHPQPPALSEPVSAGSDLASTQQRHPEEPSSKKRRSRPSRPKHSAEEDVPVLVVD